LAQAIISTSPGAYIISVKLDPDMAAQASVAHLQVEQTPHASLPQDVGPRRLRMTWFFQGMACAALMLIGVAAMDGLPDWITYQKTSGPENPSVSDTTSTQDAAPAFNRWNVPGVTRVRAHARTRAGKTEAGSHGSYDVDEVDHEHPKNYWLRGLLPNKPSVSDTPSVLDSAFAFNPAVPGIRTGGLRGALGQTGSAKPATSRLPLSMQQEGAAALQQEGPPQLGRRDLLLLSAVAGPNIAFWAGLAAAGAGKATAMVTPPVGEFTDDEKERLKSMGG